MTWPERRPTWPMAFLEILNGFTGKLLKHDKKVVLGYLDKRIADDE